MLSIPCTSPRENPELKILKALCKEAKKAFKTPGEELVFLDLVEKMQRLNVTKQLKNLPKNEQLEKVSQKFYTLERLAEAEKWKGLKLSLEQMVSITKPVSFPTLSSHGLTKLAEYEALIAENEKMEEREWVIPKRRTCNISGIDAFRYVAKAMQSIFIPDEEILEIHSLRFLSPSPFLKPLDHDTAKVLATIGPESNFLSDPLFESAYKQLYAIAVTKSGKHVILQQAIRSCVATCIAMLVLDHGKIPDYDTIRNTGLATTDDAIRWIEKSGLEYHLTRLDGRRKLTVQTLIACLKTHGPGLLTIKHPLLNVHEIVLDSLSIEKAEIRDPFHGWALTIPLHTLLPMCTDSVASKGCFDFLQVADPSSLEKSSHARIAQPERIACELLARK